MTTETTEGEEILLKAIGDKVAGPRFMMMNLDADAETLEFLDDLVAMGLVESR